MDGLSAAASLVAVLQLTGTVASLGYQYISSVTRAPKDVPELLRELNSLYGVLENLQSYFIKNPQSSVLEKLNAPNGALPEFFKELNDLHSKLTKTKLGVPKSSKGLSTIIERFKWPLKDKKTVQTIQRLERYKTLFMLAMTTDHM